MSRVTLDQISKMPPAIQAQVIAQMEGFKLPQGATQAPSVDSPLLPDKTPQKRSKRPSRNDAEKAADYLYTHGPEDKDWKESAPQSPNFTGSLALDSTPVYIPAALLRHILENWAGAYYVASTETQRRRVVDNAIKSLAQTA